MYNTDKLYLQNMSIKVQLTLKNGLMGGESGPKPLSVVSENLRKANLRCIPDCQHFSFEGNDDRAHGYFKAER